MKVPLALANGFGEPFQQLIARFAVEQKLLPEESALSSPRFVSRSIVPHVEKLSALFNRSETDQASGLDRYWKESSNPTNLRLAYFLYFMPCNLYRVAAVWAELSRLGYRWNAGKVLRAIEPGAGPASGAAGVAAGERFAPVGLPQSGNWALIEQDRAMLELGSQWAHEFFGFEGIADWETRNFHRKVDFAKPLLPRSAPAFNLWVMSYFLNEAKTESRELARWLLEAWDRHLEDEGLVILIEPALKRQSRRLLELRKAILEQLRRGKGPPLRILLPCLGHQACGALVAEEDWCHEEVTWWRPPYFKRIDEEAGLDRKTLPFSYLVLARSGRPIEEILPGLAESATRHRLVSPAHAEGRDLEFFVCGQDGKQRARFRPSSEAESDRPERGSILLGSEIRGDSHSARIQKLKKIR